MPRKNNRKSSKRRAKAKLNKLKNCGPDGIFGALSDEILLHIMTYLSPNELTRPPCMRFRRMTIDALKTSTSNLRNIIPHNIRDNMIKHLFMYPVCYYYFLYYNIYNPYYLKYQLIIHKKGDKHLITYNKNKREVTKLRKSKYDAYEIVYNKTTNYLNVKNIKYQYKFNDGCVKIICTVNDCVKICIGLYEKTISIDSLYHVYVSNDRTVYIVFDNNIPIDGIIRRMNNRNSELFV